MLNPDTWTSLSLPLGCLWGEQLVRELNWEWAEVIQHDHEDLKIVGVFSEDRSLAIYPFHFVHGCIENKATVTIALAYNMLKEGSSIPKLPSKGYENVMDHINYIIPSMAPKEQVLSTLRLIEKDKLSKNEAIEALECLKSDIIPDNDYLIKQIEDILLKIGN
ncbi:MAG: hypothetical protein ACFFAS_13645 [Promethearchaeota archaeon]